MATHYDVVPAEARHIPAIAGAMRASDAAEVWASAMVTPQEALELSLSLSPLAWTGTVDGRPVCMFGASQIGLGHGTPWLLATAELESHATAFLRRNRHYVGIMLARCGRLSNFVDARNIASIRWLRWLGFTVGKAESRGPFALPFHPFDMRRSDV